jgi:Ca2+-binding EF-hand superfamily protein
MLAAACLATARADDKTKDVPGPIDNLSDLQDSAKMVVAAGLLGMLLTCGARADDRKDLPGPIDSLGDLQDTGKMLFKLADTNNDGQISQKEAVDAGNLLVGGFFFRADQNGDGTLTKDEARQAREALFRQQPLLKVVLQRGKQAAKEEGIGTKPNNANANANATNAGNQAQNLANLLDSDNDQKLSATELRQAVQSAVQGFFAAGDANRDNQLSPAEINAAMQGAARTAMQASFQQADANNDGQISKDEFDKALTGPAHVLFGVLDADGNDQLSQQEMQQAMRVVASQLRMLQVPEPANSLPNQVRSGNVLGAPNRPAAGNPPR